MYVYVSTCTFNGSQMHGMPLAFLTCCSAVDHSNPRVMWEMQVLSTGTPGSGLGLSPRGGPPVTSAATLTSSNGIVCCQTMSNDSEDSDWDNWSNDDEEVRRTELNCVVLGSVEFS